MLMHTNPAISAPVKLPALAPGAAMRWDAVKELIPADASTVLEIGCGRGAFAARIAQMGRRVTALEPDPISFGQAKHLANASLDVVNRRLEDMPGQQVFDLVCAFEVIEHLEDDAGALNDWAKRVKPGGTIVVSAPAHADRMGAWDEMVGHFRRYDPANMRALMMKAGLHDIEIRQYGYPAGPLLEMVRNQIATKRLRSVEKTSFGDRTASSGRQFQPEGRLGQLMKVSNPPLCWLSRRFPNRGVGLVARARRQV